MSTIQREVEVKAIEIDLGDGGALFVNWENIRTIEVVDIAELAEFEGVFGTIPAKAAHVEIELCYINDQNDDTFDSSLPVDDVKRMIRSEIERLNNGGLV